MMNFLLLDTVGGFSGNGVDAYFFWVGCFLVGSIPVGFLVAKTQGVDIRKEGSGNIGATNVLRILGKKLGYFTFAMDVLKGAIPLLGGRYWFNGYSGMEGMPGDVFFMVGGLAVILGHNFCPWLGFKGGKGIASSAGVLLALIPFSCLATFLTWVVTFKVSRFVSVASIAASVTLPMYSFFIYGSEMGYVWMSLFLGMMGVWRHRSNIRNLVKGEEYQFNEGKSEK